MLRGEAAVIDWIVIGLLYIAGIGFFRLIGGLDSAADGLRKWGGAYAERQRARNRLPSVVRSSRRPR
jgi:hypothetical protein